MATSSSTRPGRGACSTFRSGRRSAPPARRRSARPRCRACRGSCPASSRGSRSGSSRGPGRSATTASRCESGPGHTGGLRTIITPTRRSRRATPASAPIVLKRRHVSASRAAGSSRSPRTQRHAHQHGDVEAGSHQQRDDDRARRRRHGGDPRPPACSDSSSRPHDVGPQVVRDRARADAMHEPATTARMVANAAAENSASAMSPPSSPPAAERLRQQRRGQVAALADGLAAPSPARRGAEADHGHSTVNIAIRRSSSTTDGAPPCVGHGEEAHQDVRQAGGADEDRQPGREHEGRWLGGTVPGPDRPASRCSATALSEHLGRAEMELRQPAALPRRRRSSACTP